MREPPYDAGRYTLAVAPWSSPPCLARAAAGDAAAVLGPGEALDVTIEVTVFQPANAPLRGVGPGGKIESLIPKEG